MTAAERSARSLPTILETEIVAASRSIASPEAIGAQIPKVPTFGQSHSDNISVVAGLFEGSVHGIAVSLRRGAR